MKILMFSDIHGVVDNLDVLKNLDGEFRFDKIVCLGDLYYTGPTYNKEHNVDSIKVMEFLMSFQDRIIVLRGNCDSDVDIKATDVPISNLSLLCVDGLDIYLTHGNEYNKDKNRKFNRKGVLVYGHEHIPYIVQDDLMTYINVGSISLPRNELGASYVIYENRKFTLYKITGEIIDEIIL